MTTAPTSGATSGASGTSGGTADGSSGTTEPLDGECHARDQACPPGQKCTLVTVNEQPWTASGCVPAQPDGGGFNAPCKVLTPDEPFSGLDDCAIGFVCVNFDKTGEGGDCVEICDEDDECPNTNGGDAFCAIGRSSPLGICSALCDPLIQDCPAGQGCYGDSGWPGFLCIKSAPQDGSGEDGSPCEFTNACAAGFSCVMASQVEGCDPGKSGCCTPYCTVGDEAACAPSEGCVPFYEEPPVGLEKVGVCMIPR